MRNTLAITLISLLIPGAWLAGYDVYLLYRYGVQATISWQTYHAARDEPLLPLLVGLVVGILMGHLFWPQR